MVLLGLAGLFTLNLLHHHGRSGLSLVLQHGQVTQHGVIELEAGFDFSQGVLADFDVQAQVVGLGELVDLVSQLTAAPVFNTVNLATGGGDQGGSVR